MNARPDPVTALRMLPQLIAFVIIAAGCATNHAPPYSASQYRALQAAWNTAQEQHSIQTYEQFIQEYGESNSNIKTWRERDRLVSLAGNRITEIETWIGAGKNIRLLSEFLEKYPESKHATEAEILIGDLSVLSPDETRKIIEHGTIAFATDQGEGMFHRKLYGAGFHTKCHDVHAPVQIVYEYDDQRLGASYRAPGSSDTVAGRSGALGSVFFEIRIDGDVAYAAFGQKKINPEARISASATSDSIDRVGDRRASEIKSELLKPINQAIDKLAKSKRASLLDHLDNINAQDMTLLNRDPSFRGHDMIALCRWGAFLTVTESEFRYHGKAVSVAKETASNLLKVCGGHYHGMPYSYELRLEEKDFEILRKNGLVLGTNGTCDPE